LKNAPTISDSLLSCFSEFIAGKFGLHYPEKRRRDLVRHAFSLADDFGFPDGESCIRWIVSSRLTDGELDAIACRLTIGETYFFRERKSFDALETHILRPLVDSRRGKERRLRIWSAGCATGEEAYSLAILLHRMLPDLPEWNISILATDINPAFLRKASGGEYGEWSFRGVPRWLKEKYFTVNGNGRHVLADPIRKMVTFDRLNLADDPYPSLLNHTNAMDIIFCRNVLMYFSPDRIKKTVGGFRHSLLDDGWLVVSPCEVCHGLFPGFRPVTLDDAVFYRKERHTQPWSNPFPVVAEGNKAPPENGIDCKSGVSGAVRGKSSLIPLLHGEGGVGGRKGTTAPAEQSVPAGYSVDGRNGDAAGSMTDSQEKASAVYRQGDNAAPAIRVESVADRQPGSSPVSNGETAVRLARALANQGKFTEALEWLEKAVSFDKLNPEPYYLKASIFQEQGFDDAAAVSLKKAIYVDHGYVLAHYALAGLDFRRGRRREAFRHLENAAALLRDYGDDELLPGADGLSVRRLAEIIAETRENIAGAKKQLAASG